MERFYFPGEDVETFVLTEFSIDRDGISQSSTLVGQELVLRIEGSSAEGGLLMAYAVVLSGEKSQRTAVARKLDRKSRNIELGVETIQTYLTRTLCPGKKGSRKKKMNIDNLREAGITIRAELGVGDAQPSMYSYQITEDVVAVTGDPGLQQQLRRAFIQGDLDDIRFEQLKVFLDREYPQEAGEVLEAVAATRSREHISAISLETNKEKGWLLVTVVNSAGKRLTLLEHKFRDLLKHPNEPRILHKYTWEDRKRKETDFIFTEKAEGMVVAKLDTAACALDVVCLDEHERGSYDRARFILDLDYACCLYIVLERIREDRERYGRLLEQAEASVGIDPFFGGFFPHHL